MPDIKRSNHFQNLGCFFMLSLLLGGFAIYYGNVLGHRYHDDTWQVLGFAGFGLLQFGPWYLNRAKNQMKCPQCRAKLPRDDLAAKPKADPYDLKFTCQKCDVLWDASVKKRGVNQPRSNLKP